MSIHSEREKKKTQQIYSNTENKMLKAYKICTMWRWLKKTEYQVIFMLWFLFQDHYEVGKY